MAAQPPAVAMALGHHLAAAEADFIDAGDLETGMMEARPLARQKGQHMVIAAARTMQERHHALRAVAQTHAEHAGVEIHFAVDIGGEAEHMAEAARLDHRIARRISARADLSASSPASSVPRQI